MKTVHQYPHEIQVIDGATIELSDGIRLSAKIWLPKYADASPVPAILEYLPYRYQDGTAERDALTHPYFAGHGYASIRVDMRGCGNSEGVIHDEYLKQEQDDALEVIDWITDQSWCSGSVGIIGISWGGFNGLQIAARQPDALKAIVTICSTDDRYADDVHHMGGAMLVDNIAWSTYMFSLNTTPPDPQQWGERWLEIWTKRLEESGLWLKTWLEHQHRDSFYRHGSVCEDYESIKCAVYAVGGWADGYSNAVFRMMSNLSCPSKGLIGPWAHLYPHFGKPGPAIGFLQECLRWWDYWFKGIDTGIMDEPKFRCWMLETAAPNPCHEERAGRWVAENGWPSRNIVPRSLYFTGTGLTDQPGDTKEMSICSPQTVGLAAGAWCSYSTGIDQPRDQREEAGGCLNLDSEPLTVDLEILGAPMVRLRLSCDQPQGLVVACLNEILPDGSVSRVSYGVLNLTHRNSHAQPQPVIPGETYDISIQLNEIAHKFEAGSSIRLSLSTAYWPIVWPSQNKTTLKLETSGCQLELPVRPPQETDHDLAPFQEAESAPVLRQKLKSEPQTESTLIRKVNTGEVSLNNWFDEGIVVYDDYDGWTVESTHKESYTIHPDEPCSAECDITWTAKYSRGEWEVSSRTHTNVTSTPSHFILKASLFAWKGDVLVSQQEWNHRIKRDQV